MDHTLIHDGKHLLRVVKEYAASFNQVRPHQGIGQHIPGQSPAQDYAKYS